MSACAGAAGRREDYAGYTAALRAPLRPEGGTPELIRFATLAPNGHNTQPWRFTESGRMIALHPDMTRRTPVVDPDDHHLFISLGAAAAHLELAGAAMGRSGRAEVRADGAVRYRWTPATPRESRLVAAIPARQSTRSPFDGRDVAPQALRRLDTAARAPGVRMVLLTGRPKLDPLADLIVAANGVQMDTPEFVAELKHWMRFNAARAMATGDGLYTAASGNPVFPDVIGSVMFDAFFRKAAENRRYARQMASTPAAALFFAERADPAHWTGLGMAVERFLLTATAEGLATAFVNQPAEVAAYRQALAALAGEPGLRPDLVIRVGHAPRLPYAPRRPVSEVLLPG
ncbi:Acg family FMN-binding oxidoreductase [Pseudodonghicola flavimaris]|uniref:Acg family FMN-binding oxidoreductase n=1 Tax=Pseudodonghicola flavimaris TaxID=3050036 RepID=UPI00389A2414